MKAVVWHPVQITPATRSPIDAWSLHLNGTELLMAIGTTKEVRLLLAEALLLPSRPAPREPGGPQLALPSTVIEVELNETTGLYEDSTKKSN